ncbi:MAG: hypothetical protein Q9165_007564 [Trypethelium subeluteriae]
MQSIQGTERSYCGVASEAGAYLPHDMLKPDLSHLRYVKDAPNLSYSEAPARLVYSGAPVKYHVPNNVPARQAPIGFEQNAPLPVPVPEAVAAPVPDKQYIQEASLNHSLVKELRRLLVVIDPNGTVLYRPSRKNPTGFKKRPQAKEFIKYLFDNFDVMVWSSAKNINVEAMCKNLLTSEQQERLVKKWGRENLGLTDAQFNHNVQIYKRLTNIWTSSEPEFTNGTQWNQSNTVLIDTSLTIAKGEPYNALEIPAFRAGLSEEETKKDVFTDVMAYLKVLSKTNNVSQYLREYPFDLEDEARTHKQPTNANILPQTTKPCTEG